jgi:hypothetical protein
LQQDNDCDGRPDNTIDSVCQCSIGASQACQAHPGQDGVGRFRAGSQQCLGGQNNSSAFFGACGGSVGPAQRDACTSINDDDCDGLHNDGCQWSALEAMQIAVVIRTPRDATEPRVNAFHASQIQIARLFLLGAIDVMVAAASKTF